MLYRIKVTSIKKPFVVSFQSSFIYLKDAYEEVPDAEDASVRTCIYENLGIVFNRGSRGVYLAKRDVGEALLTEGNSCDLRFLEDDSIDAIITDNLWNDKKPTNG